MMTFSCFLEKVRVIKDQTFDSSVFFSELEKVFEVFAAKNLLVESHHSFVLGVCSHPIGDETWTVITVA